MDKTTVLVAIITLLVGFIGGFMLANSLNRSEFISTAGGNAPTQMANTATASSENTLSPEEIRSRIAEADGNPDNFSFQKNLGIALYRYGAMKQDEAVMSEAVRILTRANTIDQKDFDVLVALGNGHFDLGYAKRETDGFDRAREFYAKALAVRANDTDVQTDIGISYFVQPQPDLTRAAAELEKVTATNPRHDRSMQFLAQVYIQQKRLGEAEKTISKIREVSPGNPAINELTNQLSAAMGTN
jgi:tetratricopeptide (TPR) repeat protein